MTDKKLEEAAEEWWFSLQEPMEVDEVATAGYRAGFNRAIDEVVKVAKEYAIELGVDECEMTSGYRMLAKIKSLKGEG